MLHLRKLSLFDDARIMFSKVRVGDIPEDIHFEVIDISSCKDQVYLTVTMDSLKRIGFLSRYRIAEFFPNRKYKFDNFRKVWILRDE